MSCLHNHWNNFLFFSVALQFLENLRCHVIGCFETLFQTVGRTDWTRRWLAAWPLYIQGSVTQTTEWDSNPRLLYSSAVKSRRHCNQDCKYHKANCEQRLFLAVITWNSISEHSCFTRFIIAAQMITPDTEITLDFFHNMILNECLA